MDQEGLDYAISLDELYLKDNSKGAKLYLSNLHVSKLDLTKVKRLPKAPHIDNIDRVLLDILQDKNNELYMGDWHLCKTTHCRGGWYVHLAGKEGIELEEKYGNDFAAALIFHESYPDKLIPDWYSSNEKAMEDIEKNAGIV